MPDYQNDLLINEHKLDEEWITQPSKMMSYAAELAQAIFNRNRAKENLDVVEASLDSDARQEPTPAGLGKATETAIKNWIKLQETYREALEAYHDTDLEVNLLQGAVNAFNHRKAALENLVKLFLSGYWSEPGLGDDGKKIRERGEERVRDDLNAALNRPEIAFAEALGPCRGEKPAKTMFAIGPRFGDGAYDAGPFKTLDEALTYIGSKGWCVFRISPDSPPEAVKVWERDRWVDAEAPPGAPAPARPLPIIRKKK
jgi:hypothetical protein